MVREKTITLDELRKELVPEKQTLMVEPSTGLVVIWLLQDEEGHEYDEAHFHRVFKIRGDAKLTELDYSEMIEEISEYLKEHVPVKAFLKDVLRTTAPEEVIEIFERIRKKAKVRADEGCFLLLIGGKVGKPVELSLRG